MTPPSASRTPPQLRWEGSQNGCSLALELAAKPWCARASSPLRAGQGISAPPARSCSQLYCLIHGCTPRDTKFVFRNFRYPASAPPAGLTSWHSGSRPALPGPPALSRPRSGGSVDSGSSIGHGDAPRFGSVAHVSHTGPEVKHFLYNLSSRVLSHHVEQKLNSASQQCLYTGNSVSLHTVCRSTRVCVLERHVKQYF
jgi:hypothetical protein